MEHPPRRLAHPGDAGGGRVGNRGNHSGAFGASNAPLPALELNDVGLTKMQSHRWQALAGGSKCSTTRFRVTGRSIPENDVGVEAVLEDVFAAGQREFVAGTDR